MKSKTVINVQGTTVGIFNGSNSDFISITDIAKYRNQDEPFSVINNWMRSRSTIDFLGLWEKLNNSDFKPIEFDRFRNEAGNNYFVLSPQKWIETTNAKGIISKSGRYGGTFAHKDIVFEFASWISPEFKLYLITEFQRLKEDENSRLSLAWNLNRTISKINHKIHTDAIKEHLVPKNITKEQANHLYANEADILNVALFGKTAKQWRAENLLSDGNIRDNTTMEQLLVLANIESMNAEFIRMNLPQKERLLKLNQIAIVQLKSLINNHNIKKLK